MIETEHNHLNNNVQTDDNKSNLMLSVENHCSIIDKYHIHVCEYHLNFTTIQRIRNIKSKVIYKLPIKRD